MALDGFIVIINVFISIHDWPVHVASIIKPDNSTDSLAYCNLEKDYFRAAKDGKEKQRVMK
jgi:hypothetical protein